MHEVVLHDLHDNGLACTDLGEIYLIDCRLLAQKKQLDAHDDKRFRPSSRFKFQDQDLI